MQTKSRHIQNIDQLEAYIQECEEKLISDGKFTLPIYYNINGPTHNGDNWTLYFTAGAWFHDKSEFLDSMKSLWERHNDYFTRTDVGVIDGMDLNKMRYYLCYAINSNSKGWEAHRKKVDELRNRHATKELLTLIDTVTPKVDPNK